MSLGFANERKKEPSMVGGHSVCVSTKRGDERPLLIYSSEATRITCASALPGPFWDVAAARRLRHLRAQPEGVDGL